MKKVAEIAADICASGKEVDLGEKAEQIEKKTSLDQKKVETIIEKTGGIKLSKDVKGTELKQVCKEKDVSVHETYISVAEEFKLNDVAEEKHTYIKVVELSKEAELKKGVTNAVFVVTEEKDVSIHEAEISVASNPVQERKKEYVMSKSRKNKRQLEDLQAGVKHHTIYHTKKASLKLMARHFFLEKSWSKKGKNDFLTHTRFAFMSHTSSLHLSSKESY